MMRALKNINLRNKKCFLFDLDGTLYLGDQVLPGAVELVSFLRGAPCQLVFFTNNSSRSLGQYRQKLRRMGFQAKESEIIMSTHTLISRLQKDQLKRVFCLGTPAMKKMLKASGIVHSEKAQAVVVGFDKTLTYQKLWKAAQFISQGRPYYVTHPDYFCPTPEGPEPDCGAIAELLEKATGVSPRAILGKPHPSMIAEVRRRWSFRSSEMLMVGDRLQTDIAMAHAAGIDSLLVLSGDSSRRDVRRSDLQPGAVIDNVRTLLTCLKKL